jgi:hypothetical protein
MPRALRERGAVAQPKASPCLEKGWREPNGGVAPLCPVTLSRFVCGKRCRRLDEFKALGLGVPPPESAVGRGASNRPSNRAHGRAGERRLPPSLELAQGRPPDTRRNGGDANRREWAGLPDRSSEAVVNNPPSRVLAKLDPQKGVRARNGPQRVRAYRSPLSPGAWSSTSGRAPQSRSFGKRVGPARFWFRPPGATSGCPSASSALPPRRGGV